MQAQSFSILPPAFWRLSFFELGAVIASQIEVIAKDVEPPRDDLAVWAMTTAAWSEGGHG